MYGYTVNWYYYQLCSFSGEDASSQLLKENSNKSDHPGERMYLDITSMRYPSFDKHLHWALVVDQATHYKNSFFLHHKNDQIKLIFAWIKLLLNCHKVAVKNIHLDNAGENQALEKGANKAGYGSTFEYTAPGTPQQNGVADRAFPALLGRGRVMMNQAGFTPWLHKLRWCEAVQTATDIDDILVIEDTNAPPLT